MTGYVRRAVLAAGIIAFVMLQTAAGAVEVSGELKQWHKVTVTLDGPMARELDSDPNPFTDHRMTVTFAHASGAPVYVVPGYFAADGNAGETSADAGSKWRAHLCPDKTGKWTYRISFATGKGAALDMKAAAKPIAKFDGKAGEFTIAASDKSGRDFRGRGRLQYVGKHYLQFAGSKEYFLKAGPDAPETFLAFKDFDGATTKKTALKTWKPHERDFQKGDPTWKGGKGKGIIGAVNYLAAKGCTGLSFLTYNAGGDGDNVWPMVARDDKLHYDCSKLDQWRIVLDHAQSKGLYLHFKLQETENDDNNHGKGGRKVPAALDGGDTGVERKLYLRELIARFGYELALNWNLGEENTQSLAQQLAMAGYIRDTDPYGHNIVIHTYPGAQDKVYRPLLGKDSPLTGASLQNGWNASHKCTLKWVTESAKAGKPWVVANDEQNSASTGAPPDPGYKGFDPTKAPKGTPSIDDIRKHTLWGNLMAGGAGVEYYFGYKLPQNDLLCEDYRSRDKSWDYCRIALEFFTAEKIPFWEMKNADALIGNPKADNSKYCFAKSGEIYLVYLPKGGSVDLDLSGVSGAFSVQWFNPRSGGKLQGGSVAKVKGGSNVSPGQPPSDADKDWLAIIRR